jgi:hypothetical protein
MAMLPVQRNLNYKAASIVKNPSILDDHPADILMTYEICAEATGEDTANAIVVMAQQGWIPIVQSASVGGGFSGRHIVIYTTFQKRASETPPPEPPSAPPFSASIKLSRD